MTDNRQYTNAIVRLKDILSLTGLSRTTLYDKMNPRSPRYDASFPKRVKLGDRAVGWKLHEIEEWIDCTEVI